MDYNQFNNFNDGEDRIIRPGLGFGGPGSGFGFRPGFGFGRPGFGFRPGFGVLPFVAGAALLSRPYYPPYYAPYYPPYYSPYYPPY